MFDGSWNKPEPEFLLLNVSSCEPTFNNKLINSEMSFLACPKNNDGVLTALFSSQHTNHKAAL
jgi:hypothetical protein